jgi:hypothetical protein
MARPDFPGTIVKFQERFPDETACLEYLAASRWPEGYRCPTCGGEHAWVLERRHLWECTCCHHQTSITAGTVMHGTRTPLRLWFWAAYLVATHTPGISAKQLQRQLGPSRYETAWLILQKLRRAMVAPEREPLRGEVEVDEGFLGGVNPDRKAGRDPVGKRLVGVAVEVPGTGSGRLRLARCSKARANAASVPGSPRTSSRVRSSIPTAGAATRDWPISASTTGPSPNAGAARNAVSSSYPPTVPSNVKTWLQGTHRSASEKHLQVYLDEFVFRHNRRRTPMAAFQTLLGLGAAHEPSTYAEITSSVAA